MDIELLMQGPYQQQEAANLSKRDLVKSEIRNLHLQATRGPQQPDSPHFLQKEEGDPGLNGMQKFGSQAAFTFRAKKGALKKIANQSRGRQSSKKTTKRSTSRNKRSTSRNS